MPAKPILTVAGLLLWLGACAAPEATAPPAAAPPAQAAAAPAGASPGAEAPLPPLNLWPRERWQGIRIDPASPFSRAWRASPAVRRPDGTQRRWIVANLKQPIPLPETGGRAYSVAFVADYRCDQHSWRPVETVWFGRTDARAQVLVERPRGDTGERPVAHGTLVDMFLDAACGIPFQPPPPGSEAE